MPRDSRHWRPVNFRVRRQQPRAGLVNFADRKFPGVNK